MSIVSDWYAHENIILFQATLHEEHTTPSAFLQRCQQVQGMGKRVFAGIIVKPEHVYDSVPIWEKFWSEGLPMHFTPLMRRFYFSSKFIFDVVHKYRTSCSSCGTFFIPDFTQRQKDRKCIAGTKKHFGIHHDGTITHCSSNFKQVKDSTIFNPCFNTQAETCCETTTCFCEQMSGLSLANENQRLNYYVETGQWIKPTIEEVHDFIGKMHWDYAGRTYDNVQRINLFEDDALTKIYSVPQKIEPEFIPFLEISSEDRGFWSNLTDDNSGMDKGLFSSFFPVPKTTERLQQVEIMMEFPVESQHNEFYGYLQNERYEMVAEFYCKPQNAFFQKKLFLAGGDESLSFMMHKHNGEEHSTPIRTVITSNAGVMAIDNLKLAKQLKYYEQKLEYLQNELNEFRASRWSKLGRILGFGKK